MTIPKNIIVKNADNEWLGPSPCGFVSEVNGLDAGEVPAFVPTRHELLQIARYWADVELDLNFFMAIHQCVGSDWLRKTSFAARRIGRIERALGGDDVERVVEDVRKKLSSSVDPRYWKAFVEGDKAGLRQIAEELHKRVAEHRERST